MKKKYILLYWRVYAQKHTIYVFRNETNSSTHILTFLLCCSMINFLVQCSPALRGTTQTGNLFILQGKFVVVGDFFIYPNWLLAVDHNLLFVLDRYDLGVTIWLKFQKTITIIFHHSGKNVWKIWNFYNYRLNVKLLSFQLTLQLWFINLARFPHFVASIIVSKSIRNR